MADSSACGTSPVFFHLLYAVLCFSALFLRAELELLTDSVSVSDCEQSEEGCRLEDSCADGEEERKVNDACAPSGAAFSGGRIVPRATDGDGTVRSVDVAEMEEADGERDACVVVRDVGVDGVCIGDGDGDVAAVSACIICWNWLAICAD
jgi:hypothetical protein